MNVKCGVGRPEFDGRRRVCHWLYDFTDPPTVTETDRELTMADLEGAWDITVVYDEIMPVNSQEHRAPFIQFVLQDQRVHGNSGCNTLSGSYSQKPGEGNSLILGEIVSTRMDCPGMGMEWKILDALHEVVSFHVVDDDERALRDENEEEVIRLKRKVLPVVPLASEQ